MSGQHPGIEKMLTRNGEARYRVRWRSRDGRHRSKSFHRLGDAKRFRFRKQVESELKYLGASAEETPTLDEFVESDWIDFLESRVSKKGDLTRGAADDYVRAYRNHISPRIGDIRLGHLAVDDLADWQDHLEESGAGSPTEIKALTALSSILKRAAQKGRQTGVQSNPTRLLQRPRAKRTKEPIIFSPEEIERLRLALLVDSSRKEHAKAVRDACLVSLMYFAGLRPGEALALRVSSINRDLCVDQTSPADGSLKPIGKGATRRFVPIRPALRRDLDQMITLCRLSDDDLLFPGPGRDGAWTSASMKNWRRRQLIPAQRKTGIPRMEGARPYDIGRHSHSALMLASDITIIRLAEIQGHSVRTLLETYAATVNEFKDQPPIDPDLEIEKARQVVFESRDPSSGLPPTTPLQLNI